MAVSPDSCLIKIGTQKFRSLVDSGAEVSLTHRNVYQSMKDQPKLIKKYVNLQSVNGDRLVIDGCINISFEMKNTKLNHTFFVVKYLNRKIILGRDWLIGNGVRMYFDLGCLRVGNTYIPLKKDIHIASVVRLAATAVIKPQTAHVSQGKLKQNVGLNNAQLFQVTSIENGYISNEPGLTIANSVIKPNITGKFPVLIVNNTNKTIKLRKGCAIGRAENTSEINVTTVRESVSHSNKTFKQEINPTEISASGEFEENIIRLIDKKKTKTCLLQMILI